MTRPAPRELEVLATRRLTPNMHRITLGGADFAGYPSGQAGGYVKLVLPAISGNRSVVRTYTIRHQHHDALDIDFALHGDERSAGPATRWAVQAKEGDVIQIGGPGPAKPLPKGAKSILIAGDITSLPAISVNLEALDAKVSGHAFILIQHEADRQAVPVPEGVKLHWLINPDLGSQPDLLADQLRALPWLDDLDYAWAACEFDSMKAIRAYLREERGLGRERLYISSYWKRGLMEDEHKDVKKSDAAKLA